MKLIFGLGNPGEKYKNTRHNVGWMVLDRLREKVEITGSKQLPTSLCIEAFSESREKILLVYPQTFMNSSGEAVSELLDFYKLSATDILVIHDEVDLPLSSFKFTDSSSSAGHNGVQSIIDVLGTQDFKRIRIGIESRESKDQPPTETFVLQPFSSEQLQKIPFAEILKKILEETK